MRLSIASILSEATERLKPIVQTTDQARGQAELLLAHVLHHDRSWLIGHSEERLSFLNTWHFHRLVHRRLCREPLAYVLGKAEFCGRTFFVNKQVLIPRPETEELVALAEAWIQEDASHTYVIDIGTGSGAIAVSLALNTPGLSVLATDLSAAALQVARKNADRLDAAVTFLQADLFDERIRQTIHTEKADRFAFLVNLPYVPETDRKDLMPEVTLHEPHAALFAGWDGLGAIRPFLQQASEFYTNDGRATGFFLEFDPSQTKTLHDEASYHFPEAATRVVQDACGRERFLEIICPNRRTSDRPL